MSIVNYVDFNGFSVVDMGPTQWCYNDGFTEYDLTDIDTCDVVLDIGACYGGFALKASTLTEAKIICVEPVWDDVIALNAKKNDIDITVIQKALSHPDDMDKGPCEIEWNGKRQRADRVTMASLLKPYSKKNVFVKCDCEMGEWNLIPSDFKDIDRLEIEFHLLKNYSATGRPVNVDLVTFLEKEYHVVPANDVRSNENGIARTFHMYKKKAYPDGESAGPLRI